MITVLFFSFITLLLIGVPIAYAIGIPGLVTLLYGGTAPITMLVQRTYGLLDSYTLMAIPFFILSGELMLHGGLLRRMINFASALIGHIRGSLAQTSIVASIIFSGVSGSSTANASAIGSLVIPSMKEQGYDVGWVAALQACSVTIGPLIPPSMLMIFYVSLTGVSIGALFLGGIVPRLLVGFSLIITVYIFSFFPGYEFLRPTQRASIKRILSTFIDAIIALITPIIIIGGIVFGVFTATEAGIVATVYAFIVGKFAYNEIKWSDFEEIFMRSAIISSVVLLIAAFANSFGWILAWENFPNTVGEFFLGLTKNKIIILISLQVMLLILTMFVESLAALILFAPVLYQIGTIFAFHPIHYGLCIVMSLLIGQITPPVGVVLYVVAGIAKCDFKVIIKNMFPFYIPMLIALTLVIFFPVLVTFIPSLVFK